MRETLPLRVKLCFGAPAFADSAMAVPIAVHMPRFYSDVVLAPLCAIAFVALFTPPRQRGAEAAALWFGLSFGLYFLFHTLYAIPHAALGAEISLDYHGRSTLFGCRKPHAPSPTCSAAASSGPGSASPRPRSRCGT